jgi:excisionase family DNA binding protein
MNESQSYFDRSGPNPFSLPANDPRVPRRMGSSQDAARILGCSTSLVRWLIATGELEHVERPGKRLYLLDLDEVHRYRLSKMEER